MSKKKKKNYALDRNTYRKNRRWAVDNLDPNDGYVNDLKRLAKSSDPAKRKEAEEALAFLSKFNDEYYNNKGLKKKDALMGEDKMRKSVYGMQNAANRDVYSIKDSGGAIIFSGQYDDPEGAMESFIENNRAGDQEQAIIELLDVQEEIKKKTKGKDEN